MNRFKGPENSKIVRRSSSCRVAGAGHAWRRERRPSQQPVPHYVSIGSMNVLAGLRGNRALQSSLLSFGFAFTAEWAFTVAIGLVAFADGGAVAVGVVGLIRLLPAALLAPAITAYADRMPRERVLFASSAIRGVATLAAAPVLAAGGPVLVVYALAVVSTVAFTPYRASHSALMPSLCRTPDELTSVNVARGALDSVSVIVGPLVAALLVAVADLAAVFAFAGACALVSAGLVARLRYERIPLPAAGRRRLLAEVRDGLAAVTSNAGVAVVVGLVVLQAAIRGAFTVFVLVVAIDLLNGNQSSVGILQGVVGIGALAGSTLCTLLVGSRAMTRWLGVAVVLWGAPLAIVGVLPYYATALLAAGVIGVGNSLVDVTAFTLIARMAPNAVMARVFGVTAADRAPRHPAGVGDGRCCRAGGVPGVVATAHRDRWVRGCADRRHRPAPPGALPAPAAGTRRRAARAGHPAHAAAPGRGGLQCGRHRRQLLRRG
jgi:hypothetical protein